MVASKKKKDGKEKVVLVILDGWGIAPSGEKNAISLARKPNFEGLEKEFGVTEIGASGEFVGLTPGQMGNSEVGHLTIGAGRVIFQDLMRVTDEIRSGRLERNRELVGALDQLKKTGGTLHLLGLVSDGGVHSHIDHLFSLLDIARKSGVGRIVVHAFLDGRDTPPQSGADFIKNLEERVAKIGNATIGTLSGRFYSMDRDNRWDRTKQAYDAIIYASGKSFKDPVASIKKSYQSGVNDEFLPPEVNQSYHGVKDGDLLLFFNFRPDRARQLTRALSQNQSQFKSFFDRNEKKRPKKIKIITMTIYDPKFGHVTSLLPREHVRDTLSNVLEKNNVRQLHLAETEKYAHVTYFFNGLVEKPRRLEQRIMVPSLKIGTYDKMPEMSARAIASEGVRAIDSGRYGFILVNFANADMVGHSGLVEPTVKAVETVDACLGELFNAWKRNPDFTMIITSDHGNAEKMFDQETGQPHTAHTSNPVPLIVVSKNWKIAKVANNAGLIDIAPSILTVMGIRKPRAMTGKPFVERA
jgi:2,3-bisphosphoglycerate-independent phosphoglycerate mutase